jgi:hypothetical protein
MIPRALRIWFVIHFVIDVLLAIPLMIAPRTMLTYLGWSEIDPLSSRLVAAALLAIGIESLLARGGNTEVFRGMLNLKLIWSAAAVLGIALSLSEVATPFAWLILGIFAFFNLLWLYWRLRLPQM